MVWLRENLIHLEQSIVTTAGIVRMHVCLIYQQQDT